MTLFFLSQFITSKVLSIDIIGEFVAKRILSMLLMTIFFLVLFSALVTSLTAFYTAEDLNIILSLPIGFESIFFSRIYRSFINSSWMPLGFILPVVFGFASTFGAKIFTYILIIFLLVLFFIIPVTLGSMIITVIVRLFPATRIKEVLVVIGIIIFSLMYIWFRMFQPERFLNPDGLSTMIEFIIRFDVPGSILIPSTWVSELIFASIKGTKINTIILISLTSTSIALIFISAIFIDRFYLEGFSRANEGKKKGLTKSLLAYRFSRLIPISQLPKVILYKDLLEFVRQPSQWSQLILLFALLVVYVYNFKHFKNIQLTGLISQWGLYFLNMGLCGFVIAALGARFIFPAISLERNSFYIYKVSPISMKKFVYSKFFIYSIPLTVTSGVVTLVSNMILDSTWEYFTISVLMSVIIALVVSGIGISIGAIYPNFKEVDIASIPASIGGVIYMILSMTAIIILILLTIWPTSFIRFPEYAAKLGIKVYIIVGLNIALILLVLLFSTIFMLNYASHRLEKYEE
ncbi:MAG: hypothetical protein N2746_09835 [Deltaproteobacteria bacterium]|nr:hypothetical protein [Deltaproteobacteria bacterium]